MKIELSLGKCKIFCDKHTYLVTYIYIYLPGVLVGLAKPHWLSMYNAEKRVPNDFVTYTHFFTVFCDLHTLF